MEYPFYLEQKFFDVGRLETRTLTAQEAEALNYEDGHTAHGEGYTLYVDGYNSLEAIQLSGRVGGHKTGLCGAVRRKGVCAR